MDEDDSDDEANDGIVENAKELLSKIAPVSNKIFGTKRALSDYFAIDDKLCEADFSLPHHPPLPLCTFSHGPVAF